MTDSNDLLKKKLLLRPDEAAEILRVSKKSIYRRCKAGTLKTASHNPLRITAKSVREYIGVEVGADSISAPLFKRAEMDSAPAKKY